MASTYDEFAAKTTSEKAILCHIEPAERLLIWTLDSGAIYTRSTDFFVIDVKVGTVSLTEASSAALNAGEWYYNLETGVCYIRMSDDSNPSGNNVVGYYRQFFSNIPMSLPYDLGSGAEVPYLPYVKSNSVMAKALDEEQTGIALESVTKIILENTDGFFDDTYDTLFYENKNMALYSWSPSIPITETRTLFIGTIQDKSFSPVQISFNCKDFVFKLREKLTLPLYSLGDGTIPESTIGTPKRRIYGKCDGVECVPLDNVLDGYDLTGTLIGGNNSDHVEGVGTFFLSELSPNDTLTIVLAKETLSLSIESIESNTELTLTEEVETDFLLKSATVKPRIPWSGMNRRWSIAGHKLREPTTTVASATQPNRMILTDGSDIFENDILSIDGTSVSVKRIEGNNLTLNQNLASTPSGGEAVVKNPVSRAFLGTDEGFITSEWTLSNTTEAIISFSGLAEFNLAPKRILQGSNTFTNGSRTVTASGVNFTDYLKSRDFIQSDDITHTNWYEILAVEETEITLRDAYTGGTTTGGTFMKNPVFLDDDSLITVDCIGYENGSSQWVKTASDCVLHLLENDSVITNINSQSFTDADNDAPYIMSMLIPERVGDDIPTIKDVISDINQTVFGSLVTNTEFEAVYNILTAEKPEDLEVIKQHDIIGEPTVKSRNEIVRKVNLKYRPFVDRFTGKSSFQTYEYTNDFVDDYIGSRQEKDLTVFLYSVLDAVVMAQRVALYRSLSQSIVSVKAKLNLSDKNLNDKLSISLDRIYKRFSGRDRKKIGIINKITTDGTNSTVEFNDLSNIFNRVMSIAPDAALDFTSALDTEKILNAYVCDDSLEVPDTSSDAELGSNIIG